MSYDDHSDSLDWRNDPDASAPPTPEEQQQMIEAMSIAQALAFLRERGYAVVEPVEIDDGSAS